MGHLAEVITRSMPQFVLVVAHCCYPASSGKRPRDRVPATDRRHISKLDYSPIQLSSPNCVGGFAILEWRFSSLKFAWVGLERGHEVKVQMLNQFNLTVTTSIAIIGVMALLYGGVRFLQAH